jgi:4-hydroxythreonine-4-phosphate dehydrogenase
LKSEKDLIQQLAVTVGDSAGIGPEILLMTLADVWEYPLAKVKVFGPRMVLFECARKLVPKLQVGANEIVGGCLECEIVDIGEPALHWNPGFPSDASARAAWMAIDAAIESVLNGDCAALVTGPISKAQMMKIGFPEPGHTDYLATRTKSADPVMLYDSPVLKVALVTTHIPLKDVSKTLSAQRIVQVGKLLDDYLKQLNTFSPRIAVAGFNPHGGSGDIFGSEENTIIAPAVELLKKMKLNVEGPVPPDTVFLQAREGKFDAVISLYHDQGSIPVKTLDFQHTVNVTLGLPIIRTSVDHGTAFSIAGKGEASHLNLRAAISLAGKLARNIPSASHE